MPRGKKELRNQQRSRWGVLAQTEPLPAGRGQLSEAWRATRELPRREEVPWHGSLLSGSQQHLFQSRSAATRAKIAIAPFNPSGGLDSLRATAGTGSHPMRPNPSRYCKTSADQSVFVGDTNTRDYGDAASNPSLVSAGTYRNVTTVAWRSISRIRRKERKTR